MTYSGDKGATWGTYYTGGSGNNLLGWESDLSDIDGQGNYDLALAIDPDDANTIFVGGISTYKTTDGGTNWSAANFWSDELTPGVQEIHADKHMLAYHPLDSDMLFECNDGGIYKSTDGGSTWTDISAGLVISQLYSMSCSQQNSDMYHFTALSTLGTSMATW